MRQFFITPLAAQDLEEIGDYIAHDNPNRAASFVLELQAQCQKIRLNPLSYRLRPELLDGLRSCAYGNYVIFFEATESQITIIRVLHGARDIATELNG